MDFWDWDEIFRQGESRRSPVKPTTGTWTPPVDIYETDKELVIIFEVPGVSRDQLNLELKEDTLTLSGTRILERGKGEANNRFHRIERHYGNFQRSFLISLPIDYDGVKAVYRDGLLEVKLPKAETQKPKQIHVKIE